MADARLVVAENQGGAAAAVAALREHGAVLGRVCMALLGGDREAVEKALERVAREVGAKPEAANHGSTKAWLLGLARVACATQLSKVPVRTSHGSERERERERARAREDAAPATERIGDAADAASAREPLATLKPTEREAIVLHVVGGLDAAGVATACGTDEATARARIARGLVQLAAEPTADEVSK